MTREKFTLYRICTEATGAMREVVIKIVGDVFNGFTVIDTDGVWVSEHEKSMIIELMLPPLWDNDDKVTAVCEAIKQANEQQAVLVMQYQIEGAFI